MAVLEICVDSLESAIAAEHGGADRIELCSSLIEGGITPSLGLMRAVRSRVKLGIHVLIRPRAGDFLYSRDEIEIMQEDIALVKEFGADGVVLGLLTIDGSVDVRQTEELVRLAHPMEVTFHRAIDMTRDIRGSIEDVIRTGVDRILTAGGQSNAIDGSSCIRDLLRIASSRIGVMVGGGVRIENVQQIAKTSAASEFHASLKQQVRSSLNYQSPHVHLGDSDLDDYARNVVYADDVKKMRQAIDFASFDHSA